MPGKAETQISVAKGNEIPVSGAQENLERPKADRVIPGARLLLALLALHSAMLAWVAVRSSPTIDEPGRVMAGVFHWRYGVFAANIGNPPLVDLVGGLPATLTGAQVGKSGREFGDLNGSEIFRLVTHGRWLCIPFSLLGAIVCWRWAADLFGPHAGLLAATLWCFCPLVLANGALVTGDIAAASMGSAAFYAFWQWLRGPNLTWTLSAGLLLGAAQLTKFVWVVMPALWLLLWVIWRWSDRRQEIQRAWYRDIRDLGLMGVLAAYLINVGYGFSGSFQPLSQQELLPHTLKRFGVSAERDWATRHPIVAALPVPLPADYISGIDAVACAKDRPFANYLDGVPKSERWLWFYPYGLLLKTPLGGIVLFAWASAQCFFRRRWNGDWRDGMVLGFPVLALFFFVTWATSAQFVRYVLPVIPFLTVWNSQVLSAASVFDKRKYWAALVCSVWFILSSLRVYPHSLSYMNEIAGGPEEGYRHLVDSDFDWGQDLLYLKRWLDSHPEARPLHLAYFGSVNPRLAGIEYVHPPGGPVPLFPGPGRTGPLDVTDPEVGPRPGWHAISVTHLCGRYRRDYMYFLDQFEPVAKAGYSIFIYHIDRDSANRARLSMGLKPIPAANDPLATGGQGSTVGDESRAQSDS